MFWFMEGMCFLPVFLVIWSSSTFIISYIIALLKHDVDALFPYISDTGATPPESGIFGVMTAITAFTSIITMFAHYKYVQKLQEGAPIAPSKLNGIALWCGLLSCLGMCVVGTFQVTLVTYVHDAGALLFFICGVTYIVLQSCLSYRMHPYGSSMAVCHTRAVISSIAVLASIPMIICGMYGTTRLHWDTHDKAFVLHLISAVCEWTVTFGFVMFFLSYIQEFKRFKLTMTAEMLVYN
ncbi:hypothetical protein AGOR_G00247320 [Albula goreensis]|uniref:CWH43-like N-terminal domain-containing protein n=1 Tax=Albula goreensis TaxID=1534307 RepID=A0A8T3CDJ5_9TELE|nr:hypothetical protein AGOR_G00247320 [Albula goreensis]